MKLSLGLLGLIWLSSAFGGEWVNANSRLKTSDPIPYVCSELVLANQTPIVIDTQQCINRGKFRVVEKFITDFEGNEIITLMRLKVVVGALECRSKLRKQFKTMVVDFTGEITVKEASWKVVSVTACKSKVDYRILEARPGHRNVKYISKARFDKLPKEVKENIKATDLSSELGDGYYDYLKTTYYLIVAESKVIGFLEKSRLQYRDTTDKITALVRYNVKGERLGEIEVY